MSLEYQRFNNKTGENCQKARAVKNKNENSQTSNTYYGTYLT